MPPTLAAPVPRYGLAGDVVTMDDPPVLKGGIIFVDASTGKIAALQTANTRPPVGFEKAPILKTHGTIYPGLIELHNHLCYDLLPLWQVPRLWDHRDQWPNHPDYLKLIRGPAQTLGNVFADTYLAALVRYVEAKCLMGGVTASQGITLQGINTVAEFRGNLRNVDNTGQTDLPSAYPRIGDLGVGEASAFLPRLQREKCALLHLSEGRRGNEHALDRFDRLQLPSGDGWAITPALAGIHCAALREEELEIMRLHGAAMVWSPMSNLLLYGTTADVATAKAKQLRIALGSDWSPSGSKNLLGELKVAWLYSQNNGNLFSAEDLVKMATTNAAQILGWDQAVGRIKPGMYADLLVVQSTGTDPYRHLIGSTESDIRLVVIGGTPLYGRKGLMAKLAVNLEPWKVGTQNQAFAFTKTARNNPIGVDLPLKKAQDLLRDGLHRLPELSKAAQSGGGQGLAGMANAGGPAASTWRLAIDDDVDSAFLASAAASVPFKEVAVPVELDPLTVIDDSQFLTRVEAERNLPDFIRQGLRALYT